MNENTHADTSMYDEAQKTSVFWSIVVSALCHMIFIVFLTFLPDLQPPPEHKPNIIKVSIVRLPDSNKPTPVISKKTAPKVPAPAPLREKASLHLKKAKPVKQIKKQVEKTKTDSFRKTLEELRHSVEKTDEKRKIELKNKKSGPTPLISGTSLNNDKQAALLDIYKAEVAYFINRNWAFSEQIAGNISALETKIVFSVMPDGQISNVFFTEKSGNQYFNDSVYKAVVKSSPVQPHPAGISSPYVQVGLRFTPQGIK